MVKTYQWNGKISPLSPESFVAHIKKWTKEQLQVFTDRSDLWNLSMESFGQTSTELHFGSRHNSSGVKGELSARIPFRKDR